MTFEVKRPPFALYPEERHWWSFNDYGAVLGVVEQLRPRTVLEFGPGSSTLALLEGGAEHILACEDNPIWFNVYKERLVGRFPGRVNFAPYQWADPITIPDVDDLRFDLALIDGPLGTEHRPPVIAYCLARCRAVLVPTEDHKPGYGHLRGHIRELAQRFGQQIDWIESGLLSGAFALMTPMNEQ